MVRRQRATDVRIPLAPNVAVTSARGRECLAVLDGVLRLLSTHTGKVVATFDSVRTRNYSVGATWVAWQATCGVCAAKWATPHVVYCVHKTSNRDVQFAVSQHDVLYVVESTNTRHAEALLLSTAHRALTRVARQRIATVESIAGLNETSVSPLRLSHNRVWWLYVASARVCACGVSTMPWRHGPAVVHATLPRAIAPRVPVMAQSQVVHTLSGFLCAAVVYTGSTTDVFTALACGNARTGEWVQRGQTRRVAGIVCDARGNGYCVFERGSVVRMTPTAGVGAELSNRVGLPPNGKAWASRLPMRVCTRCRERHHESFMGTKMCLLCAKGGSDRQQYGMAVAYARHKHPRWTPSEEDMAFFKNAVWGKRPVCWLTSRKGTPTRRLVFTRFDQSAAFGRTNVMLVAVEHARATVSSAKLKIVQARLRNAIQRHETAMRVV